MKTMLGTGLSAALFVAVATPAQAASYMFDITGSFSGSGTFTTADAPTGAGSTLVTAISGTFNNAAITTLLAPASFGGNDNLLFPGGAQFVSGNGITFQTGSSTWNLYYSPANRTYTILSPTVVRQNVALSVMPAASAVPEPAAWAMMIVGMGLIGGVLRRRRTVNPAVSFG